MTPMNFNAAAYPPGTQAFLVDPGDYESLPPGTYVLFMDPTYPERSDRSHEEMIAALNGWGNSFSGMTGVVRGMGSTSNAALESARSSTAFICNIKRLEVEDRCQQQRP